MADNKYKLIGHNYTTPDLVAKVTGKAKYAEDFRADGMLFCRLLLSPMPHARIRRLDTSAALALPGVKGILTANDLPAPAASLLDDGRVIAANPFNERPLTNEPLYRGEPILAVAAVDEQTAAEAIELIEIEWEPLPFVVDPLEALRPNGPNARVEGTAWTLVTPTAAPAPAAAAPAAGGATPAAGAAAGGAAGRGRGGPAALPQRPEVRPWKWEEADFAELAEGKLPMGKPTVPNDWSYGDLEAGFKKAALVLDETFMTPMTPDVALEPRTVLAYWQNGKVIVHCSTQSTAQTVGAVARGVGVTADQVVVVAEYCGGGFGSKVVGATTLPIPALLSKKLNAPVQMRISREEETYIGKWRAALLCRMKIGFAKDGRITAVDMYSIIDNGPYEQQSDLNQTGRQISLLYQPEAMRWRGIAVLTNIAPTGPQSSPGGQVHFVMSPLVTKAAKQLGLDRMDILKVNAPVGKAQLDRPNARGERAHTTSAFVKEALDKGAEQFRYKERMAAKQQLTGSKVRGIGVAVSSYSGGALGFDGLVLLKPDGRLQIQSGIGNLGTHGTFDCHRVSAEVLDMPWEKVDVVWGDTRNHLPWSCVSGGSSTLHAHTRAAWVAGMDAKKKLQQIAATTFGGPPESYTVANERVSGNGRSLTFADAAKKAIELGGAFDGHEAPADLNRMTKQAVAGLVGQGLIGVARDSLPRDGVSNSFVAAFAEVELDKETGKWRILDYLSIGDVGTVINPRSLGGQLLGRSTLGMAHILAHKSVYDKHYGLLLATRMHYSRPPTILDVPEKMAWDAVGIPDPETPVGARGIGEPPVGSGGGVLLSAIADALGEDLFQRAPVMVDSVLTALDTSLPRQAPLVSHI